MHFFPKSGLGEKCMHACSVCFSHVPQPVGCSLPGCSVHGILQARILEWIAAPFSRGSFQAGDWTWVSYVAGWLLYCWASEETPRKEHPSLNVKRQFRTVVSGTHTHTFKCIELVWNFWLLLQLLLMKKFTSYLMIWIHNQVHVSLKQLINLYPMPALFCWPINSPVGHSPYTFDYDTTSTEHFSSNALYWYWGQGLVEGRLGMMTNWLSFLN